ncbi:glycoside hydrolase family 3 protein [Calidifontibacter sp. DB0510]|uniref:Glycoside hydrolase family 3 protein n=1 Tax=Metallococcus carri TaxID=1656884 RepID=A0A967B5A9_9MICO|nr:glycoside hydrolase family 3 protein [Metallococcus carri]NHN54896.1 glycoside hydrolase family 3 protein [Metallococcus carri]NOP37241.1 glycoside hydrolase family 3 protein [Calidifontibacter sp. DB2511S]
MRERQRGLTSYIEGLVEMSVRRLMAAMSTAAFAVPVFATAGAPSATAASTPPRATGTVPRATGTAACTAEQMAVRTSIETKVGQMFMVGEPAAGGSSTTLGQISTYHVGNIFLSGRSTAGVSATASVSAAARARSTQAATAGIMPFISTDQEGGYVQVLQGPGFSSIPTALTQGTYPDLYYKAQTWAGQLRSAGVNMNLAPVADTVPSWLGRGNPPIGYYYREFGYDSATTQKFSNAFSWGMRAKGVAPTVKHFPGLGLVNANTDTTTSVHDARMTRYGNYSSYLNPFKNAAATGVPFTMVSSAIYDNIDGSQPAVFSSTIVQSMLRSQVGFKGVVMSDDIGAAAAMSPYSYATRATRAVNAGVQLLLTVTPNALPSMYNAVLANARSNATFGYWVNAAALQIYRAKQAYGLLPRTC